MVTLFEPFIFPNLSGQLEFYAMSTIISYEQNAQNVFLEL